jgi:hypothetical protein
MQAMASQNPRKTKGLRLEIRADQSVDLRLDLIPKTASGLSSAHLSVGLRQRTPRTPDLGGIERSANPPTHI